MEPAVRYRAATRTKPSRICRAPPNMNTGTQNTGLLGQKTRAHHSYFRCNVQRRPRFASQKHLEEAPPWKAEQGSCSKRKRIGVTWRCPPEKQLEAVPGATWRRRRVGTRWESPGDRPHGHGAAHGASVTAQAEYTTYSQGTRWPRLKKRVGAFSGG